MFSTIKYKTPSGYPRAKPHLSSNVEQYNHVIRKHLENGRKYKLNRLINRSFDEHGYFSEANKE